MSVSTRQRSLFARGDQRRPMVVEPLEGRQLLSASVPAGYVSIGSVSVSALSGAGADTPSLVAGQSYYFVADGAHQLATDPAVRQADAAGYEKKPGQWVAGTHLHVGSISWGSAHDSGSQYGADYTASADGPLHAYISDSFYGDNSGSITLTVYQKVTLQSLTVADDADTSVTVAAGGTGSADFVHSSDSESGSDWNTRLHITGSLSVEDAAARLLAKYRVVSADGSVFSTGALGTAGADVDVPAPAGAFPAPGFTVEAWLDRNQNGVVDGDESIAQVMAASTKFAVKVVPQQPNSRRVYIGDGQSNQKLSINFQEGKGQVVIVRKDANGQDETVTEPYDGGTPQLPIGLVVVGKIVSITVNATASTVGTISVE